MVSNVLNSEVKEPNRGAEYYRCALQVNPPDYAKNFRGEKEELDASAYARATVEKAVELEIRVLAITDHNDVGSIPLFRKAAEGSNVIIFPGFELSSVEGIHVLCIYSPGTSEAELERFLGEFGIREPRPSSKLSDKGFLEIIAKVQEQGGVAIAAHVTTDNGLFEKLSGQACIRVWKNPRLLAIQIPGSVEDLPENIRPIVENQNVDYRREHPVGEKLALAVVNACDIWKPAHLEKDSATCWIKMSEIGIEGLRQAFLDPESRIRLNSDPFPDEHAELVFIEWKGGFLDELSIDFNSNLNVFIGGRGAGKSTVIESIRYVLGFDPIGDDIRRIHEGFIKGVLKNGTKISLVLHSYRPEKKQYIVERTVPNPPIVYNDEKQELHVLPSEIFPNVEVYGQHEISNLSKASEKRIRLLDRFSLQGSPIQERRVELSNDLIKTRQSLLDVRREIRQIEEQLETLSGLEERMKSYQEAGIEELLGDQSQLVREEQLFESISTRLNAFDEYLEPLKQEVPIDVTFLSEEVIEGLLNKDIFEEGSRLLKNLSSNLGEAIRRLVEFLENARRDIELLRSNWKKLKRDVQTRFEEISRDLQKQSIDSQEFIVLKKDIERLLRIQDRHDNLCKLESLHESKRQITLNKWQQLKDDEFKELENSAKKVNKMLQGIISVKVVKEGDRATLYKFLGKIKGRLSETIETLKEVESFSLSDFASCCLKGKEAIREMYAITEHQAQILADAPDDVLLEIEELELPPLVEFKLNTSISPDRPSWRNFDDLSTGQKATVALLILLLESDAPLIVDQPEDDLDNRFITENVIPKIRKEKGNRQFIFATHNANVPVLGDAELILGLTGVGEPGDSGDNNIGKAEIDSKHMGSIDSPSVRRLVEEILEGGEEAFERRRRKYGF